MSKFLSALIAIAFSAVSLNVLAAAHTGAAPAATEAAAPAADAKKDEAKPAKKAKKSKKSKKAKKDDAAKTDAAAPAAK